MRTLNKHWTERSTEDFLYRIASDFVSSLESSMAAGEIKQADLASALGVTEGRVSQVLNNPGNLTLKKVVEYARALGLKVAIVTYDDGDADNAKGPINAEIFSKCWERLKKPSNFFELEDACKLQARSDCTNRIVIVRDFQKRAWTESGGLQQFIPSKFSGTEPAVAP